MTWAEIGRAIWAKVWPFVAAVALLAWFAVASVAIGKSAGVVYAGVEWLNVVGHVPIPLMLATPLFLAFALGMRNRALDRSLTVPPAPAEVSKYEDDPSWYRADWKRDPDDPEQDPGTEGYRLELVGGPLAGRTARLRDSRFRLYVLTLPDGSQAVRGSIELPTDAPKGATLLGSYGFSHGDEAMVWSEGNAGHPEQIGPAVES